MKKAVLGVGILLVFGLRRLTTSEDLIRLPVCENEFGDPLCRGFGVAGFGTLRWLTLPRAFFMNSINHYFSALHTTELSSQTHFNQMTFSTVKKLKMSWGFH